MTEQPQRPHTYYCCACGWVHHGPNGIPDAGLVIDLACPNCGGNKAERMVFGSDIVKQQSHPQPPADLEPLYFFGPAQGATSDDEWIAPLAPDPFDDPVR